MYKKDKKYLWTFASYDDENNSEAILIELNKEYIHIAKRDEKGKYVY